MAPLNFSEVCCVSKDRAHPLFDSSAFEPTLISILLNSIHPTAIASDDCSPQSQTPLSLSNAQWATLLAAIFRPTGVAVDAWQTSSELLCRCLINAETLGKALRLAHRFPIAIGQLRTECNSRETLIVSDCDATRGLNILQLASYLKFFSWLIDEPIPPLQVHVREDVPAFVRASPIQKLFNCEQRFECNHFGISIASAILDRPVVRTYSDLRMILALPTLALIPWSTATSIGGRVAQLIAKSISRHEHAPTLGEVAFQLGRSSSSLRRQLHQEDTSFQAIKDTWRKEQAEHLLLNPANTLEFIASRLGFECSSVFSRAFKSWTGLAPSQFRQAL